MKLQKSVYIGIIVIFLSIITGCTSTLNAKISHDHPQNSNRISKIHADVKSVSNEKNEDRKFEKLKSLENNFDKYLYSKQKSNKGVDIYKKGIASGKKYFVELDRDTLNKLTSGNSKIGQKDDLDQNNNQLGDLLRRIDKEGTVVYSDTELSKLKKKINQQISTNQSSIEKKNKVENPPVNKSNNITPSESKVEPKSSSKVTLENAVYYAKEYIRQVKGEEVEFNLPRPEGNGNFIEIFHTPGDISEGGEVYVGSDGTCSLINDGDQFTDPRKITISSTLD
ncbi:hypothetical protein [Companilactobacillus mishanensis]|uniref:Lipoprotein n=1 Tax=Companilactobacillus mishanensis TaxID=2486008 RepID=A0ABW9P5S1_9LACO|nr:hypothetical protein [Companilactobacillus mishanensis]MQS44610.1 hypothetical protein [Companilactobacillus mishanensis]